MKNLTAVVGAVVAALTLGLAAVGCSSGTKTDGTATAASTTASTAASTTSVQESTSAAAAPQAGAGQTLDDYIKANNIQKTTLGRGDPGPKIDLPVPPGWQAFGATPDASYGGIVFSHPVSASDPPRINADLFKLTGNVDPAKVLTLAPAGLKSIPGFQSLGDAPSGQLGGFKAGQAGGSYTKDGNSRLIAQKTVVIPGDGGVFVLQLTADGLESDMGPLMDATSTIDKETKITP
jgi:Probable lipoprotein LpqN